MNHKKKILIERDGLFSTIHILLTGLVMLIVFSLTGCDNAVEPLDEEKGVFSIYGALDMNSDINYIRVRDLNAPIREGIIPEFNGRVLMENLSTSDTQQLKDTLTQLEGIFVWNFESTLPINPETTYQISAIRPDGQEVIANATTPNRTELILLNNFPDCTTRVTFQFEPVSSGRVSAEFGIEWRDQIFWTSFSPDLSLDDGQDEAVKIRFTPLELIEDALGIRRWCHELPDNKLYARYTHLGPDFFEDTVFDSLEVPGGAGNFGAYYEEFETFVYDTSNVCFPFCPR